MDVECLSILLLPCISLLLFNHIIFVCVIRDNNRNMVRVLCGPLGVCDFTKVEVMGLHELKKMGVRGCLVEGDSATVIG